MKNGFLLRKMNINYKGLFSIKLGLYLGALMFAVALLLPASTFASRGELTAGAVYVSADGSIFMMDGAAMEVYSSASNSYKGTESGTNCYSCRTGSQWNNGSRVTTFDVSGETAVAKMTLDKTGATKTWGDTWGTGSTGYTWGCGDSVCGANDAGDCNDFVLKVTTPSDSKYDGGNWKWQESGTADVGVDGGTAINIDSKTATMNFNMGNGTRSYARLSYRLNRAPNPEKVSIHGSSDNGSTFTDYATFDPAPGEGLPSTTNVVKLVANASDADSDNIKTAIYIQRRLSNTSNTWEEVSGGFANMWNGGENCTDLLTSYCTWSNSYNPNNYKSSGWINGDLAGYDYRWAVKAMDEHSMNSIDSTGNAEIESTKKYTPWGYFKVATAAPANVTLEVSIQGQGTVTGTDNQATDSAFLRSFKAYANHSSGFSSCTNTTDGLINCVQKVVSGVNDYKFEYVYDRTVTLTATAAVGWSFTGWTITDSTGSRVVSTNPLPSLKINENTKVTANNTKNNTLTCLISQPSPDKGQVPLTTTLATTPSPGTWTNLKSHFSVDDGATWPASLDWGAASRTYTFAEPGTKIIRAEVKADNFNGGTPVPCDNNPLSVTVDAEDTGDEGEEAP